MAILVITPSARIFDRRQRLDPYQQCRSLQPAPITAQQLSHRLPSDLLVQQQFCDEVLIRTANGGWFRPSVVSVFVGWTVSVMSFEVGAPVLDRTPRICGDQRSRQEQSPLGRRSRRRATGRMPIEPSSGSGTPTHRIDLKSRCGKTSVPWTWFSVSHTSGPALINTIQACRQQRARVEMPDRVQQFAQLLAVIAPWYFLLDGECDFHVRVRQEALANRSQWKLFAS